MKSLFLHMQVLLAPDSFKGSLSAFEVCDAIKAGITNTDKNIQVSTCPLADGGEGTSEIICRVLGGTMKTAATTDPLGRPLTGTFALLPDYTAIIDMATASGITHLSIEENDPRYTSTYGTGLLIQQALDAGAKKIILGLGGSATNDGGAGMAMALGYRLLDKGGKDLPHGGIYLQDLHQIDPEQADPRLQNREFVIATDVTNPLLGEGGASYVFGPQKGADEQSLLALDHALAQLAHVIKKDLGKDVANIAGAGAAGGLGAGGVAFLHGKIESGFELISRYVQLEEKIKEVDLIITGEGMFDATTAKGKVISGVMELAQKHEKPLIVLAGNAIGKHHLPVFTLVDEATSTEKAISEAKNLLKERAEYIFRVALPKLNFNL